MRRATLAISVLLVLPAIVVAQAQITPLANHEADDALMERIATVVEPGDLLKAPAIVFASIKPGAEEDGLGVMLADFPAGDASAMVSGRLVCLLLDPSHLAAANVLTVRLVVPEGGDLSQVQVALETLANEGGETIQLLRQPNTDTAQPVMPVPRVPQPVADTMATVGALKVGAVTSPRGLHVIIGPAGGAGQAAAFTVPTLSQLKQRGTEWGEHAALP